jgi:hypothetical protein
MCALWLEVSSEKFPVPGLAAKGLNNYECFLRKEDQFQFDPGDYLISKNRCEPLITLVQ